MTETTKSSAWIAWASLATMLLLAVGAVLYRGRSEGSRGGQASAECQGFAACDKACSAGDACACGAVGALYLHGSSIQRDAKRGISLLERACGETCPTACFALGNAYENGAGTRADPAKAKRIFDKLNAFCRTGCDAGDPDRCFTLAGSYFGQHGVMGDHAHAEELYARAATLYEPICEKSDAHACARLAVIQDHGLGVAESKTRATELYVKACELGDAESCEEAAKRLSGHDKDLPKDEKRSAELAHEACAAGRATGCALASEPDAFMKIVESACAAGSPFDCGSAAFALGHGAHGVTRDEARAVPLAARMIELLQDACLDDDGSACAALVRPFESGTVEGEPEGSIVPKDPTRVKALREHACELGFKSACPTKGPGAAPGGSAKPGP